MGIQDLLVERPVRDRSGASDFGVLFVDDDEFILKGLKRILRRRFPKWQMHFASSGQAALAALAERDFDAIVSDMHMPMMDGDKLLDVVRERFPEIARIMLSGQANNERELRLLGPVHCFLSKPCSPESLEEAIRQVITLRARIGRPEISELVGGIDRLPSLPSIFRELLEALDSHTVTLDEIGTIISRDIAMTAKILQLVNSSFCGLRQKVHSAVHAVSILGINAVKSLVLAVGVFTQYRPEEMGDFPLEELTDHSLQVGFLAERTARRLTGDPRVASEAALAGTVHDVGQLVLARGMPQRYAEIRAQAKATEWELWTAEEEALGATHAGIGGFLLASWGLTHSVVEAVAYHHEPSLAPSKDLDVLTAIHFADLRILRSDPRLSGRAKLCVDDAIQDHLKNRPELADLL